jgi:ABC-2 type transport system permease protein
MSTLARDTGIVVTRELRPVLRDPFSVVFSMIQPLFFLALFAPLLSDVPGLRGGAMQWFVPGIVVMSCVFGASMTGSNLLQEMQTGSHERTLVTPLSRPALLLGRALKEVVPVVAQAVVVLAVVTPLTSFELHVAGTFVGLVILAVFAVGLGSLSYALALAAKGQDWIFWTVQQTFLFPVLLLAGMLLPLEGGPDWLRGLARLDPLSYILTAERQLFAGTWDASQVGQAALAAAVVALGGLWVGTRAMRRAD